MLGVVVGVGVVVIILLQQSSWTQPVTAHLICDGFIEVKKLVRGFQPLPQVQPWQEGGSQHILLEHPLASVHVMALGAGRGVHGRPHDQVEHVGFMQHCSSVQVPVEQMILPICGRGS